MNDIQRLAHSKWNCKYHIVFAPKYRRKTMFGAKGREIGAILRELCKWKGVNIIEAEICPDHVHMLVEIPPKMSVSGFVSNFTFKPMLNEGSTALPFRPYFSGLKNAYLQSIKSTGRNLVDGSRDETTACGVTYSVKSPYIYINGSSKPDNRLNLTSIMTLPAGTYTVCMKHISGNWSPMTEVNNSILLYLYKVKDTTAMWNIIAEIPFSSSTIQKSATFTLTEETTFVLSPYTRGETYNKMVFAFQIVSGETANYDFEPYVKDTFILPETLELGEWDKYDPQTGELTIGTGYETSETAFTEEQIAGYQNAIVSVDGLSLAYELETKTTTTLSLDKKYYQAWNGGTETQEQGATDNSKYGAMCTLTNDYFVKVGGATNEQTE